jgi:glycerophosphoryl diester phosphodiesterase
MMGRVSLVAHRGQPSKFPENSLQGFAHALKSGARYVETDVQITADAIPVLSHDAHLLKVTGKQIIIADHAFDVISDLPAGYPDQFGDKYKDYRIATLQQFIDLLAEWPDALCFIELKQASLNNYGMKAVDLVLEQMNKIESQAILISFDYDALVYAKNKDKELRVGWVLPEWTDENKTRAQELEPEYLFVDEDFCPDDKSEIWVGDWQWVAYTINDSKKVEHFAGLAIEIIETDRYSDLIKESDIIEVSNDF